jgi:hypothetical protein
MSDEVLSNNFLKSFKTQKNGSSRRLPTFLVQCTSTQDLISILWNEFNSFVENKAILPNDPEAVCILEQNSKVMTNTGIYFFFNRNNHIYPVNPYLTRRTLQLFSTPSNTTGDQTSERNFGKVDIIILKYSDSIITKTDWVRFSKDCINAQLY